MLGGKMKSLRERLSRNTSIRKAPGSTTENLDGDIVQSRRQQAIKHCKRIQGKSTDLEDREALAFVVQVLSQGETNKIQRKTSLAKEFHRRGTDAAVQEFILKSVVGVTSSSSDHHTLTRAEVAGLPDIVAQALLTVQKERRTNFLASIVVPVPLKYTILASVAQRVDPTKSIRASVDSNHSNIEFEPLISSQEISNEMAHISSWSDFDVFEVCRLTQNRPLTHTCMTLLRKYNLFSSLPLDEQTVLKFLSLIEACYTNTNPYHNCTHAADVLQSLHALLVESRIIQMFSPLQLFSAFIAAAVHDVDHPGFSNAFLIALESDIAITYNGRSVLESHHAATFARVTQHPDCNIFARFSAHQKSTAKQIIVEMILGTDMTVHADMLDDFKSRTECGDLTPTHIPSEYEVSMLRMALHVADISNPAKTVRISEMWANRVMNEFFQQGDIERCVSSMNVSKECDRMTASTARVQIGFIEFIVRPLLEAWVKLYPSSVQVMQLLEQTHSYWQKNT